MADSTLSHLNHGHAGTATFDTDARDWSFARQFTAITLKQIGIRDRTSIDAIPAPVQFPSTAFSTRLTDAKDNARALVRNYPQLVPASELLPDLAATSAAVLSTTSTYDPLVGSLYSTGSITYVNDRAGKWDNPRRVAATVTGEARNILRLGFLYQHALGWGSDKSVWIRGDTLRSTETGYWNEEAAPIQQVCFSQSEDRSTLLAVRLLTKTVIFRPFYSQRPRPAQQSPYYNLPPSLIDANPILALENDESGGSPHVDITFNPDFQLQFAVVDQNHVWSVWDIDHKRKGTDYKISCVVQGRVTPPNDADQTAEDGWARILWVGDVNTILVCNRRQLSIVGLKGNTFDYLPCSAVISARTSDWILDVKRHPSLRSRFFMLTSTDVLLMGVTTPSEAVDATVGPVGARVLLSWRHYRGAEDFTLSISVSMLDENDVCVLLHSRLNNLSQTYIIADVSSDSAALVSSSDPTLLELDVDEAGHTLQVTMEPCRYQGDTLSSSPSVGRAYLARSLNFYKLFMLRSNLSVHESIVYASPSTAARQKLGDEVKDLTWTIVFRPKKAVRTIGDIQEMDDFLQPDGIEAMFEPESKLPLQVPRLMDRMDMDTAHRVVDHIPLYNTLSHSRSSTGKITGTISVPGMVTKLKELLVDSSQPPIGTLLEFADMKIDVSDVDEASSALHGLIDQQIQGVDAVEIRRIASSPLLHLAQIEMPTISGLYDCMLESWVAPLPPHVSRSVRQHKERLARRIAAEVTLASTRVLHTETQATILDGEPGLGQDSGVSMPILPSQPVRSSQWTSSQPLPTQSLPQAQSQLSSSQSLSPSSQASPFTVSTLADPIMRLRKHLEFTEETTSQEAMSDSVSRLLSQWKPGADPRAYDWNSAERATRVEAGEDIDQQQLEKARRRKERREKRQRREDELAKVQPSNQPFVQPSSQPFTFAKPTAFSRSSPGPMLPPSSQAMGQQSFAHVPLPAASSQGQGLGSIPPAHSQVEPGKFGGRPDKKKKKRGRVSGF